VTARLSVERSPGAAASAPLVLNGEKLDLISAAIDGAPLDPSRYTLDERTMAIAGPPERFLLETVTTCAPAANTALSGLYLSNGMFCTQCEAEGFRRITYFPDRPDVLARYDVRIEADAARYPVLLANGNPVETGTLADGRHFARWSDPHPKPSYLFAMVAGDLVAVEDEFVTLSGRRVALKIYVQQQNAGKCAYTLGALKRAMRWDEETFGREYDLDIFMIVAVDHFNFGAMENKGLNIFNSAYVLASPETATDADYEAIESIVAHEYFHNWSGNRVTCRDWFQLCLKEGFTVFRDQEFSADMRSRPVQRIKDVRRLWSQQFPEDAGPLAHPPRPESYITIDNFYTATVYEKGAEIVRMMKTMLGAAKFRRACDLYFARHDGEAATVEDFIKAMEDASGEDLSQFRRWYSDAGTPRLHVEERFDDASGAYVAEIRQETAPTPGQSDKPPRVIPLRYALHDRRTGAALAEGMIVLDSATNRLVVEGLGEPPVASLLTGFSAPVIIQRPLSLDDRLFLAARDSDLFNRWAQVESLWRDLCLAFAGAAELDAPDTASEADLARAAEIVDPGALVAARGEVRRRIGRALRPRLLALYHGLRSNRPFEPTAAQAGERALRNAALSLLVAAGESALALEQAKLAANMTDEAAATAALALSAAPERAEALERFYARWRSDTLVVNKWLGWKAMAPGDDAVTEIDRLLAHEAFDRGNPNKVRAVLGAFSRENLGGFHRPDGAGYRLFADEIIRIDSANPQLAARLATALESWRKLEPARRARLQGELESLAGAKGVSANLYEIAARLLGQAL
jgi:aminopeptidase N